ncbi:hypothetical protein [Nonomuraea sp. KM90]
MRQCPTYAPRPAPPLPQLSLPIVQPGHLDEIAAVLGVSADTAARRYHA